MGLNEWVGLDPRCSSERLWLFSLSPKLGGSVEQTELLRGFVVWDERVRYVDLALAIHIVVSSA